MNPEIWVSYDEDLPVKVMAANVINEAMHYHPNTIEIIYVLKGMVDVKVCFENFILQPGDFVIVNHEDFHFIKKKEKDDNAVISFFMDLSYFEESISHIRYIDFVCESFSIKDTRKQYLDRLKVLIENTVTDLGLKREGYQTAVINKATKIMNILVDHFTLLQHYSNNQKPSRQKLEKYYSIMKKLNEGFQSKTLLSDISKSEFYSKFYLAHLYKGLMLMSVQDSLRATRCFKSEKLLLTTNKSIQEISTECGFSDTKYYYKHFNKWYNCTPAQYRKKYKPEVDKETIKKEIALDELLKLLTIPHLMTNQGACVFEEVTEEMEPFSRALVYLFERGSAGDAGTLDWKAINECLEQMRENGIKPFVAMHFDLMAEEEWLTILNTCYGLYETEIGGWEFCFFYRSIDQKDRLNRLISSVKKLCPGINIKAMLMWNTTD